ncbi:hypothetical protein Trydic_g11670 [Trypoxylus dichotomus]
MNGGVMEGGRISTGGHTEPYLIETDVLTDERYRDEILRTIILPYAAPVDEVRLEEHPNFGRKIIFSNELHFWMNSIIALYRTTPTQMRFTRFLLSATFWASGVTDLYLFENDVGEAITIKMMITDFIWLKLNSTDVVTYGSNRTALHAIYTADATIWECNCLLQK